MRGSDFKDIETNTAKVTIEFEFNENGNCRLPDEQEEPEENEEGEEGEEVVELEAGEDSENLEEGESEEEGRARRELNEAIVKYSCNDKEKYEYFKLMDNIDTEFGTMVN